MVTSMLEKAIEIEGLLRIIRDGNPLPETYILLNIKTAELAQMAETLEEKGESSTPEAPHADFVMTQPTLATPVSSEVVFNVEEPASGDDSAARTIDALTDLGEGDPGDTPEDLALIEEDDILLTFEDTTDFQTVTPTIPTEPQPSMEETEPTNSFEDEPAVKNQEEITEATIEDTTTEKHTEAIVSDGKEAIKLRRQKKLRSSFSLNDRFLYARELFNGNMKMFDSTLDFLEGIEDFSIIEDYFYSELEWNPENSQVAAFMEILRPNFRE